MRYSGVDSGVCTYSILVTVSILTGYCIIYVLYCRSVVTSGTTKNDPDYHHHHHHLSNI
jgi:hypothetical protein